MLYIKSKKQTEEAKAKFKKATEAASAAERKAGVAFKNYREAVLEKGRENAAEFLKEYKEAKEKTQRANAAGKKAMYVYLLYKNNYNIEVGEAIAARLLECLKKYDGRNIGDKTRAKIAEEVAEKLEFTAQERFYFYFDGSWIKCGVYCLDKCGYTDYTKYNNTFSLYGKFKDEMQTGFFYHEGKFTAPESLGLCVSGEFIENPEKRAAEMLKAEKIIYEKRKELEKIIHDYNRTAPEGIEHIRL